MRPSIVFTTLFAAMAVAIPATPVDREANNLEAHGCPGGNGGNACPTQYFQVSNQPPK